MAESDSCVFWHGVRPLCRGSGSPSTSLEAEIHELADADDAHEGGDDRSLPDDPRLSRRCVPEDVAACADAAARAAARAAIARAAAI